MRKVITHRQDMRDAYLKLIREFPLRTISDDAELEEAVTILTRLMLRDDRSRALGENDYFGALAVLVRDYEGKRYPMRGQPPLSRLKHLLEESGTTPADLRKVLRCSQPLVSLILSGKRGLRIDHIRKLADFFKVEAGYFL